MGAEWEAEKSGQGNTIHKKSKASISEKNKGKLLQYMARRYPLTNFQVKRRGTGETKAGENRKTPDLEEQKLVANQRTGCLS